MRERPILFSTPMVRAILDGRKTQTRRALKQHLQGAWPERARKPEQVCPYGAPGDRLWVRETFGLRGDARKVYYAATPELGTANIDRWRPSIHMPRWASRITLEVTGVRVERLQDITHEDVAREGFTWRGAPTDYEQAITETFFGTWDSLNRATAPVSANPWVWVVEFKRVEAEQEAA